MEGLLTTMTKEEKEKEDMLKTMNDLLKAMLKG
jgi:hypothetical protein